jgi:hypothetical protein
MVRDTPSATRTEGERTTRSKRGSNDGLVREMVIVDAGGPAQIDGRQQRCQLQERTSVHVSNLDRACLSLSRDVDARHASVTAPAAGRSVSKEMRCSTLPTTRVAQVEQFEVPLLREVQRRDP